MRPKQLQIKDLIAKKILNGEYKYGEQLPSGLKLAKEFSVSYVTINRIQKRLEQEGFVECRRGAGVFVTFSHQPRNPQMKKVNLICPAYNHEATNTFIHAGKKLFSENNWDVNVILLSGNLIEAQSAISHPDYYSVLFGYRPYFETFPAALEHARNRVVLIGERSDQQGIACVTSDEAQSIRLCMEHFAKYGIPNAMLICISLKNEIEVHRSAGWRSIHIQRGYSFDWCGRHCLEMERSASTEPEQRVRWVVDQMLSNDDWSEMGGIIAPDDETAVLLSEMLLEQGVSWPKKTVMVAMATSQMIGRYRPAISSINPDIPGHLQVAMEILNRRIAGHPKEALFHSCQPYFMDRGPESSCTDVGIGTQSSMGILTQ